MSERWMNVYMAAIILVLAVVLVRHTLSPHYKPESVTDNRLCVVVGELQNLAGGHWIIVRDLESYEVGKVKGYWSNKGDTLLVDWNTTERP